MGARRETFADELLLLWIEDLILVSLWIDERFDFEGDGATTLACDGIPYEFPRGE